MARLWSYFNPILNQEWSHRESFNPILAQICEQNGLTGLTLSILTRLRPTSGT